MTRRGPLLLAVLLGACPGPSQSKSQVVTGPPPIPTDFEPGPPLGPEPRPEDEIPGRAWLDAVHAAFHARWADSFLEDCRVRLPPSHALNDRALVAQVRFSVAGDGGLREVALVKGSGNADFDAAALEVVRESTPLPEPPGEVRSDDGNVYVEWSFARDERQDGVAGARIDRRLLDIGVAVPMLLKAGRMEEAALRLAGACDRTPPPQGDEAAALIGLAAQVAGTVIDQALADEKDAEARLAALDAVAALHDTAAAPRLRALAREAPDLRLQQAAMLALAALGDREAVPILIQAVSRFDGERSATAAAALGRLGEGKAAWALIEPELAEGKGRRIAVLATAAGLGAPDSVPILVGLLKNSKNRSERAGAALALGATLPGDTTGAAQKALSAALTDDDATVRAAAAAGLASAGRAGHRSKTLYYKVIELVRDRDPRVRAGAAAAAVLLAPALAVPEVALVIRREKDTAVLLACAEALGLVPGGDAVALLRFLSDSKVPEVRAAALDALARHDEPEARRLLGGLAAADDPHLRALATATLGDETALENALLDPAPDVRAAALDAILRSEKLGGLPRALRLLASAAPGRERVLFARAVLGLVKAK
jgi:TonB family protein